MANFNKDNRSGGGRDFNRRDSDRPAMHSATCSKCGKPCLIPFIPTGNRPIFCNSCFKDQGGNSANRSNDRDSRRPNYSDRPMYDAICDKCGNRCRIPFQPREGKPVFCSHCFERNSSEPTRRPEGTINETPRYKEQFEALNAKLDKILTLLTPPAPKKAVPVEKVAEVKAAQVTEEVQPEEKKVVKKKSKTTKKTPLSEAN